MPSSPPRATPGPSPRASARTQRLLAIAARRHQRGAGRSPPPGQAVKTLRPDRHPRQQCRLWPARRRRGGQRRGDRAALPAPMCSACWASPAPCCRICAGSARATSSTCPRSAATPAIPGWGVYGSTKFAVEGISEALAGEVAPLGIQVTVVEPGFFRTDFLDETLAVAHRASDRGLSARPSARPARYAADVNHGQRGDPREARQALSCSSSTPRVRRSGCRSAATRWAYRGKECVRREGAGSGAPWRRRRILRSSA